MSRFNIMSRDGSTVRYRGTPKYNGVFAKASYLEFSEIASDTPIEWQVGDYVDYSRTGFRYKLYTIPQVAKSATSGTAGDAFVYKNVQFYCATKDLELALFRDIVEYDNGIHFSSIPNVDTYESVYGIIDRIQANMDDFAPGQWTIRAMTTTYTEITDLMSEVRAFSVSDGTCMDALNQIYALWKGISWIYKVENGKHTIVLGRPNLQDASNTTPEFSYGEGNGLKVITRAVSTKNEMATRIYAYGSDRNLPTRYYNNLTPYIKDHESVYIPHLMLPISDWGTTGGLSDARLAYVENSTAINKYGLIPKVMRFDGTGDLEEIYPSVEGMTIGDVASSDYPGTGYSSNERIDEVLSCSNPSDNGMYTDDSIKLKEDSIGFTIEDYEREIEVSQYQEAITIGSQGALFSTETLQRTVNAGGTEGHFVVSMNGLHGTVRCQEATMAISSYLEEMPKAFLEVYIDDTLQVSTETTVQGVYARVEGLYDFICPDIKFNTSSSGYLKIFLRIEMKLLPRTEDMTLIYTLSDTSIGIRNEYTLPKTFTITMKQLGFDLNELGTSTEGLGTLSMTTGMCAGREFVINSAEHDTLTNTWVLECQRQDDTTIMQYFPNSVYTIDSGDNFVILDIQLPELFVTAAMTRLHTAAVDALSRLCKPVMAYAPEVDSKAVYTANVTLTEGLYMPIYDPDLIETYIVSEPNVNWILIETVTISEGESTIPIYSVTLRDEKLDSMLQIITGELNATQKRLRDRDIDESRIPAKEDPDTIIVPTIVGVQIVCDTKLFVSDAEGNFDGQSITLTAKTTGINNPRYWWYYRVDVEGEGGTTEVTWVLLENENGQTYNVLADSAIYFQNDRTYEDFMVRVADIVPSEEPTADTVYYQDAVRISKGGRGPKGEDGDPGTPGEDGYSKATIYLYRRSSDIASDPAPGDMTYSFADQTLTPATNLNGWSVEPPEATGLIYDPIYVTVANVSANTATVLVKGGWVTSSPAGDWSEPSRWTGESGRMGKVMRGINLWSSSGIVNGRGTGVNGYQGLDELDSSFEFYDVVYTRDATTNEVTYYYCKNGNGATSVNPDNDTNHTYWVPATQFDFVATKVLIASNAFIDVFSGNAAYMYDNSGPSGANVVAGMQGGSTTVVDGQTVTQVNFFAGSGEPQEAPFRVYSDGSFVSTEGRIGGYTYDENGLTYYRNVVGSSDGYRCFYQKDNFEIRWNANGRTNQVIASVVPAASPIMEINQGFYNQPCLSLNGYSSSSVALDVVGDIQRNNESVITSVDGNVLKVAKVTQAEYNALATTDATTLYIIVG